MSNIFLRDPEFYQRRINPVQQYIDQCCFYLHRSTGRSLSECREYVIAHTPMTDPEIQYYERNEHGDRSPTNATLSQYLASTIIQQDVLAPTGTTYINATKKPSILVEFVDNNVKRRSAAKRQSFKAEAAGLTELFIIKDNEQTNMKLYNNSMSGAFASKGSILNNPSAHSTLTSITRSVSSLGNASNEKIIAGNRHYFSPEVTLNNLVSITTSLDHDELTAIVGKYGLVYPTVDETVACVKYSTDLYWRDPSAFKTIYQFIAVLEPIERAAVVYIGDLYHIRLFNDEFTRRLLGQLSKQITDVTVPDAIIVIQSTDEQVLNIVQQICMSLTEGHGKDYAAMPAATVQTIAATCINFTDTILAYKDFIQAIFLTANVPASTAHIPNMVRRTVVLSDTDSTMFSMDEWVQWYFKALVFNDESYGLAATVMFIATQSIAHCLAVFSANIGVVREKLGLLQMKPEFTFPVMAVTSVAKHYYTCIKVKEGNVFTDTRMEVKGVHMKNSAAPAAINAQALATMNNILATIMSGEKISLMAQLTDTANTERQISESILNGEVEFFKHSKIKTAESYTLDASRSPFVHDIFWRDIFECKYGVIETTPYSVIKIPTLLSNSSSVKKWIDSIEDHSLAVRLATWLSTYRKTTLPTIYLSDQYVKAFGIPAEIKSVIDVKRIVLDLTTTNRMILETLGYFPKTDWLLCEQGY